MAGLGLDDKILITGGYGFLGEHVYQELIDIGYNPEKILRYHSNIWDLRYRNPTLQRINDLKPDAVIHLAGSVGGIGANQKYPADFFYDNMVMGANVLHACQIYKVKKVLIAGTVCSYPEKCSVPFQEWQLGTGLPEPTNAAYGLSKLAVLDLAQAYIKQYDMDIIQLVLVNMYGPQDNFKEESSHVIPALIKRIDECIKDGTDLVAWGTGNATREFLHVRDAARAFCHFLSKPIRTNERINIGTGQEISIKHLTECLCGLMGFDGNVRWDHTKPDGQMRRCLDTSKASFYGFDATENFADTLEEMINDYRNNIQ